MNKLSHANFLEELKKWTVYITTSPPGPSWGLSTPGPSTKKNITSQNDDSDVSEEIEDLESGSDCEIEEALGEDEEVERVKSSDYFVLEFKAPKRV